MRSVIFSVVLQPSIKGRKALRVIPGELEDLVNERLSAPIENVVRAIGEAVWRTIRREEEQHE